MKNSKKLIGAFAALVIALAVSVGSTFAWFTTNQKVTVTGISATVTTGDSNLEVALVDLDGHVGTYAYNLNLANDTEFAKILANTKWEALTDNGELTPADQEKDAEWQGNGTNGLNLRDKGGAKASAVTKTPGQDSQPATYSEGKYLAFTLAFRTPASDATASGIDLRLTLEKSSISSTHDIANNKYAPLVATNSDLTKDFPSPDYNFGENQKIEVNAQDAMRVAFHPVDKDGDLNVAKKTAKEGDLGKVWIPNVGTGNSGTTKNLAQQVEAMFTDGKNVSNFNGLYKDPAYTEFKPTAESRTVITMNNDKEANPVYCVAYVRVVIWLEGTDSDCLNSIFSDNVTINLGFDIAK